MPKVLYTQAKEIYKAVDEQGDVKLGGAVE